MPTFRKKPVEIEAWQWDGSFAGMPQWLSDAFAREVARQSGPDKLSLATLEGPMTASRGDWIIKGAVGEIYACKPDVFELTYDRVITYGDATLVIGAGDPDEDKA